MATKSAKPAQESAPEPAKPQSVAKAMQTTSEAQAGKEIRLAATLRIENGFEYHLDLAKSVVAGILDPDVPDVFIEVPCPIATMRRFLHTSFIKEIDVRGL